MFTVPSPCTGVCRIAPDTEQCLGCRRTLREIADWPMLNNTQKRKLVAMLAKRRD